jgi:hypothetical protein
VDEQKREQRPLLATLELERRTIVTDLERAEDAEVHQVADRTTLSAATRRCCPAVTNG